MNRSGDGGNPTAKRPGKRPPKVQLHMAGNGNQGSQVNTNYGNIENHFSGSIPNDERDCLQALLLEGQHYEDQKNQNPVPIPGTCLWALQHAQYLQWKEDGHSQLLWIAADAGCGKSVLARAIIDKYLQENIDQELSEKTSKIIIYYFFKDTSEEQRKASKALASILHQLFSRKRDLIKFALPAFQQIGKAFTESLYTLWDIFSKALTSLTSEPGHEIICLFDALDECLEDDSKRLVNLLHKLCETQAGTINSSLAISQQQNTTLKFLITSRPYLRLRAAFAPLYRAGLSIELDGSEESGVIKGEIDQVIRYQVQNFANNGTIPSNTVEYLQRALLEMKQRTYLWLTLVWKLIDRTWPADIGQIQHLINELPDGITQAYEKLLNQCDQSFARKVLQMVLVAGRPLNLDEIDVALHVTEQMTSIKQLEPNLSGSSWLKRALPGKCGHMISIIDSRVYFIHQTVKEFLTSKDGHRASGWVHSFHPVACHNFLGAQCLRLLFFNEVDRKKCSIFNSLLPEHNRKVEGSNSNSILLLVPFLLYAATYWADHYTTGQIRHSSFEATVDPKELVYGRYGAEIHVMTAAASGGHQAMVQLLLDKGATDYDTALREAAEAGHQAIVQLLLDKGATDYDIALEKAAGSGYQAIVQLLLDKGATDYDTALTEAAGGGHQAIVQLLLDKGATDYDTALWGAAYWGHQAIVQLLLDKGATDYDTALRLAAYWGHQAIVQLLLDKGATDYDTALREAAEAGHQAIVQLLLDKGATDYDIALEKAAGSGYQAIVQLLLDKGATHYDTALREAAEAGHQAIVQLLLDKGATDYDTALRWAAKAGHQAIVQLLLDKGATDYDIALEKAAGSGYQAIVQLLLDKGATHYDTALQWAAINGHQAIVQLLLDKGATHYGIALERAAGSGYQAIVQLLLDKGATHYDTALRWAAEAGHQAIVQLLLDKGATDYDTALRWAAKAGHQAIVQLLLDKGATDYDIALEKAAGSGYQAIVQLLLDKGATHYDTALREAAEAGHQAIVQLLLDKGATNYDTALQWAAINGHQTIVQLLLEKRQIIELPSR